MVERDKLGPVVIVTMDRMTGQAHSWRRINQNNDKDWWFERE